MPPPRPDDSQSKISSRPDVPTIRQVADAHGLFPPEAYDFLRSGLDFTACRIHGNKEQPDQSRHVTGQQLCEGLRDFALRRWGLLARTVLSRWNVTCTRDFGRIVFSLVEAGLLKTTENDTLDDFDRVFEFKSFESGYLIESKI